MLAILHGMHGLLSVFRNNPLPPHWRATWRPIAAGFMLLGVVYFFAQPFAQYAQHFVYLADAFLHGSAHFLTLPPAFKPELATLDMVRVGNDFFWAQGPFPAVVLMPVVAAANMLHRAANQLPIIVALATLSFLLLLRIARAERYSPRDAAWWGLAFCFSSMYIGVLGIPTSYYFAHAVAVALLLLAIAEAQSRNRAWLIGLLFAAVLATRLTATVGIIFFLAQNFFEPAMRSTRWRRTVQMLTPLLIAGLLLGWYNFARFGNFFDSGYASQNIVFAPLQKAVEYGIFGITHLPGNIYHALLAMPQPVYADSASHVFAFPWFLPDQWGMSIFLTSPYLLLLFVLKYRDRWSRTLLATISLIALPIFLYYGIGVIQFGYRYALDFFPLLFWLLLRQYRQQRGGISPGIRATITLGIFLNLWLFIGGRLGGIL